MLESRVSWAHDDADPADAVIGEVAAIVIRARELGFSATRVATALDVLPRALATIELPDQRRGGGVRY